MKEFLPFHNHTGIAGVAVHVKNADRDGVFAHGGRCNLDRVAFAGAVGDAVVGIDGPPFAAVDTVFGTGQIAGIFDCVKTDTRLVARDLRRA